jgi:hypothetical protein
MEEETNHKTDIQPKLHVRICPNCKQPYKTELGLKNWKNLFQKPTTEDWISLIILILLFLAAFAYITDTKSCRETLNNLDTICYQYRLGHAENTTNIILNPLTNLSNNKSNESNLSI